MNPAFVGARGGLLATFGCFALAWALFDRTAAFLGSVRGEAGILVCAVVLAAATACEVALSGRTPVRALAALGLRIPDLRALLWACALVGLLLGFYPVFAAATGAQLSTRADAIPLAIGMLAQGGIAEEVLFRGFLFRRLREGRSFWRAASLAAMGFVAVHSLLFLTLDFALALASLLLSLSLSFPLAWLFERSGGSIWPPAIVHAVLQGAIKLVEAGEHFFAMAIAWMILGALLPWAFFLLSDASGARLRAEKP
jgi:membrane protease YdiL (CAAX protease family)